MTISIEDINSVKIIDQKKQNMVITIELSRSPEENGEYLFMRKKWIHDILDDNCGWPDCNASISGSCPGKCTLDKALDPNPISEEDAAEIIMDYYDQDMVTIYINKKLVE